jgi:quinol---cytochrome c reductase iron-sulfur subunit, bacillus type
MAQPREKTKKSPYAVDRGIPAAYEGETVTRRRFMELNALTVGGIASAAFGLPALGFAVGPMFEQTSDRNWEPVGAENDFSDTDYVPKVITIVDDVAEASKTTVYVRRRNPRLDGDDFNQPYVAISNRCMHVGCPIRYVQASQRFICPCHGGIYDFQGLVIGGPPVRPLDRFRTRAVNGLVEIGRRFSVTDALDEMYAPRDPSNHLNGLWKYLYPPRPTT